MASSVGRIPFPSTRSLDRRTATTLGHERVTIARITDQYRHSFGEVSTEKCREETPGAWGTAGICTGALRFNGTYSTCPGPLHLRSLLYFLAGLDFLPLSPSGNLFFRRPLCIRHLYLRPLSRSFLCPHADLRIFGLLGSAVGLGV